MQKKDKNNHNIPISTMFRLELTHTIVVQICLFTDSKKQLKKIEFKKRADYVKYWLDHKEIDLSRLNTKPLIAKNKMKPIFEPSSLQ